MLIVLFSHCDYWDDEQLYFSALFRTFPTQITATHPAGLGSLILTPAYGEKKKSETLELLLVIIERCELIKNENCPAEKCRVRGARGRCGSEAGWELWCAPSHQSKTQLRNAGITVIPVNTALSTPPHPLQPLHPASPPSVAGSCPSSQCKCKTCLHSG